MRADKVMKAPPRSPARRLADILRDPACGVAILLIVAVAAGGGGVSAAGSNLAVELVAIALLAVHREAAFGFVREAPIALRWLIAATVLVPLIQLVPMPPSAWQGLPGRELAAQTFDLIGGPGWYPLSMDASRTLLAALSLIVPLAILAIGWGLPAASLVVLQRALIALGLATALFGSLHLFDPAWGDLYAWQRPFPDTLVGTFADRNATALFFVGCLLFLVGLPALPLRTHWKAAAAACGLFLALAVVLTGSRSGMALLLLPLSLAVGRGAFGRRSVAAGVRRARLAAVLGLCLVGAIVIVVAGPQGRLGTIAARFEEGDGMRAAMRQDALYAAARYWPVGAGMGTFDEVFQVDESLEFVTPRRAGRAHMDYYELALEAGLAGLAVLAGWLMWIGWLGLRALRSAGAWPARAAFLFAGAIAAQSVLSFPLRNLAMLSVAAFAVLLLARSPRIASRNVRP